MMSFSYMYHHHKGRVAEAIEELLYFDISDRDIWIDVPSTPEVDEAEQFLIKKQHNLEEHIHLLNIFLLV